MNHKKIIRNMTSFSLSSLMLLNLLPFGNQNIQVNAADPAIEKALNWAVAIANDDSHGYSQTNRQGPDYDCSSLVVNALKYAGINTGGASYTGNLKSELTQHGFTWIPWNQINNVSNLQRGDILLYRGSNSGHTEFYLGNSQNVGAHGTYNHPEQGDQTGKEISVGAYWYDNWNGVLRYNYSGPDPITIPTQKDGCFKPCGSGYTSIVEALNSVGADSSYSYRAKVAAANGISGYSGTAAQNTKMLDLLKNGDLKVPTDSNNNVPDPPPVVGFTETYFPACSSSYSSIVDALKSIGVDSSYNNRATIAAKNGISGYSGTADQNNQLLSLLKSGKLINPNGNSPSTDTSGKYYSACSSSYTSIVDGLKSIGVDSSYNNRASIAAKNGISGYSGTASQNTQMLNLLKSGKLVKTSWVEPPAIVNYTVTLNANGGTSPIASMTIASNSKYNGLPVASREGYSFDGWYTSASGGTKVTDGTSLVSASNHTLYAHWSANTYSISFENNDGTGITSSVNIKFGNYYGELPNPERIGYTFAGWYTDIAGGTEIKASNKFDYADNQTLYAHWKANVYQVSLCLQNGKYYFPVCDSRYTSIVEALKSIGADSSYSYIAKIADINGITDYSGTTAQNNKMLELLKSGKLQSDQIGMPAPYEIISITYDEFYGELPVPESGSQKFIGWFTLDGTPVNADTQVTIDKAHSLYARWTDVLNLNSSSITLGNGDQYTIIANQENLKYSSNNTDVAVVSKNGVVTALGEGIAVISVINDDSDVVQLKVTVNSVSIIGDCNDDGELSVADAVLLQKWLLAEPDVELANWKAADLCEDGRLDVFDLCLMKRMLVEN